MITKGDFHLQCIQQWIIKLELVGCERDCDLLSLLHDYPEYQEKAGLLLRQ